MNKRWSFSPEDPREKRKLRKKYIRGENWRAPEHLSITKDMRRDYPRDDRGLPIAGSKPTELVLDKRPTIMIPPRQTRIGWL